MASQPELTRRVVLRNRQGLHARPAYLFAQTAARFEATIRVAKEGEVVDGTSILDLLALGAACEAQLELLARGADAEAALDALAALVEHEFPLEDQPRPEPKRPEHPHAETNGRPTDADDDDPAWNVDPAR